MDSKLLFDYLYELNKQAAEELIATYFKSPIKRTGLIIPIKRDEKKRISEQELRFTLTSLLCLNHNPLGLYYAIEVPTDGTYNFTELKEECKNTVIDNNNLNKRSASTDLAFFSNKNQFNYEAEPEFVQELNIELKSGNPEKSGICKDILKLTTETVPGAWLHILENEDSGTLKSLLGKINGSYKGTNHLFDLYFSFLILKNKTLLTTIVNMKNINLQIDYSSYKELPKGHHQIGDWKIDKW